MKKYTFMIFLMCSQALQAEMSAQGVNFFGNFTFGNQASSVAVIGGGGGGGDTCGTTINVFQSSGHYNGGTSTVLTTTQNVTAGHTVIVAVAEYNSVIANISVADEDSNPYTAITRISSGTSRLALFHSPDIATGGDPLTVTVSGDNTGRSIAVLDVEGTSCSGALDGADAQIHAGASSLTTEDITTTATDLIVGLFTHDQGLTDQLNAGSGYTLAYRDSDNIDRQAILLEWKIAGAGTHSASASIASGTPPWVGLIQAFK